LLSQILLDVGLLEPQGTNARKSCQGGKRDEIFVSDCEQGKNNGNNILDLPKPLRYKLLIMAKPKTLQDAIKYYSDEANCIRTVAEMRWPNGPSCPACGHMQHYWLESQKRWKCKECWKQFSVKLGTIFEDSPISLEKWLVALWMLVNCKNGVSSYEIARTIGVTQKSAWFMLQRLRLGLQDKATGGKLGSGPNGTVEIDETFIGGKARNMHKSRRQRMTTIGKIAAKTAVMGMLERGGKVKTAILGGKRDKKQMHQIVRENVVLGSSIMTDEFVNYDGLSRDYTHKVINHLDTYVTGNVHTQGIENFWSLLKRGLGGTYVAVEPFHLFRYVDEQAFRFNNRGNREAKVSDRDRFELALSQIAGKRLTFSELTGKEGEAAF
jgi:transposase-like protein